MKMQDYDTAGKYVICPQCSFVSGTKQTYLSAFNLGVGSLTCFKCNYKIQLKARGKSFTYKGEKNVNGKS